MKKIITKTLMNKLIEDMAIKEAVKREKTAEGMMMHVIEEISVALKKKGVKQINGQNFELNLV